MKYDDFLLKIGDYPFFDWPMVLQLFGDGQNRSDLRVQLSRWCRGGRLITLRRGMYAWPLQYAKHPLNAAEVANVLHRPSYLSSLWALSYYAMIPEKVVMYTSVTARAPNRFENKLGCFDYRHIKQQAFFGYRQIRMMEREVLIADPEKALLDYWYLHPGRWTLKRIKAMRFQAEDVVDENRLFEYAERYVSPRLLAAAKVWIKNVNNEKKGTVEL